MERDLGQQTFILVRTYYNVILERYKTLTMPEIKSPELDYFRRIRSSFICKLLNGSHKNAVYFSRVQQHPVL